MPDKKTENKADDTGCRSYGDKRVMLSEEKDSPAQCAGCGKAVHRLQTN